jgi:hypothetical protein
MAIGLGIILGLLGLGALCTAIFRLAALALPCYAAVAVGLYAFNRGAGPIASAALALLSGVVVLTLGQLTYKVGIRPIKIVASLLFAIPAAVAGYNVVHSLSGIGVTSEILRQVFGIFGATTAGSTALARLVRSDRTRGGDQR